MKMKHSLQVATLALAGALALAPAALASNSRPDSAIQADAAARLAHDSDLKNVHVSVQDGVATLTGTVDRFPEKAAAEKAARKAQANEVRDQITIAGPNVADALLQSKLQQKLNWDRAGELVNYFNYYNVSVKNGVATVSGEVIRPADKTSALDAVAGEKGVKGVVDEISVAPLSPMDNQIRLATAHAIFSYGSLGRYTLDPANPLKIVVNRGHVGLYGVVDNNMDRQLAYMRASGVPGVFSVENHLQTRAEVQAK